MLAFRAVWVTFYICLCRILEIDIWTTWCLGVDVVCCGQALVLPHTEACCSHLGEVAACQKKEWWHFSVIQDPAAFAPAVVDLCKSPYPAKSDND